eukprot:snap_masked-scaffold_4-processed-gene-8.41-mRNA-1 protein AED:0.96 eAED:1.00 QI:0/-1/0/1/-1/1/1/0/483
MFPKGKVIFQSFLLFGFVFFIAIISQQNELFLSHENAINSYNPSSKIYIPRTSFIFRARPDLVLLKRTTIKTKYKSKWSEIANITSTSFNLTNSCFKHGYNEVHTFGLDTTNLPSWILKNDVYSIENWKQHSADPYQFLIANKFVEGRLYSPLILTGKTLWLPCWRQTKDRKNIAHFMIGYGKVFSMLNSVQSDFDNIVFYQCPSVENLVWFRFMFDFLMFATGDVMKNMNVITLSSEGWLTPNVCIENGIFHKYEATLIEPFNDISQVLLWKKHFFKFLEFHPALYNKMLSVVDKQSLEDRCKENKLRIRVFQRTEGRRSLRQIVNLEELTSAIEFLSKDVKVFSVNSAATVEEQVILYNEFDILLSTHGAQNSNLFLNVKEKSKSEVFEIVVQKVNFNFKRFVGNFTEYYVSEGHKIAEDQPEKFKMEYQSDEELEELSAREQFDYRENLKDTYIEVNVSKIVFEVEAAVHRLCKQVNSYI